VISCGGGGSGDTVFSTSIVHSVSTATSGDRRDHRAHDPHGYREFGNDASVLLDDDAADVPLGDQPPDLGQDLLGRTLDLLPEGLHAV